MKRVSTMKTKSQSLSSLWPFAMAALFLVAGGCEQSTTTSEHSDDGEQKEHDSAELDPVTLSDAAIAALGITWTEVRAGTVAETCTFDGEVVFDPARVQHVSPPYAGVVRELRKRLGDRVRPGDALAVVENSETLRPYELRAGIGGTVIAEHAPPGEVLELGHEAFTVADTSRVWAEAQTFPSGCPALRAGQRAIVTSRGSDKTASSRVDYVSPHFEHDTRSGIVRAMLDNRDGAWPPGMFVQIGVAVRETEVARAVPTSALFRHEGGMAVAVRSADGRFSLRPVQLGRSGLDTAEIIDGLEPGEFVVSAGVFVVRSAILKGSLEPDHD